MARYFQDDKRTNNCDKFIRLADISSLIYWICPTKDFEILLIIINIVRCEKRIIAKKFNIKIQLMARYTLLFFVFLLCGVTAFGQSSTSILEGKVTDAVTKEGLIGANVTVFKAGSETVIEGTSVEFDGSYSITNLEPGKYDVEFSFIGYQSQKKVDVILYAGEVIRVNTALTEGEVTDEVVIIEYVVPLISTEGNTGNTFTADDIENLPSKSLSGIAATTGGVSSSDDGGALSFRGSRTDANIVYVDGIRVRGSTVPQTEVEQLQILTGGIPAAYGDVTGGVISIITKGPSEKFSGNFEIENSNYLDPYGYLLGYASFSGPIWKRMNEATSKKETVLGYRFSVQYRENGDRSPSAVGVYKLKDDVYEDIAANPVIESTNGTRGLRRTLFLTEDDVENVKARPNSALRRVDVNGKFDLRINKAIDMSFGGSLIYSDGRLNSRSVMNYENNGQETDIQYRGFGRFRHRIGSQNDTSSIIRNINYTLQFSYERRMEDRQSHLHEDRLFDYGYVGAFDWTDEIPLFESVIFFDTLGNGTLERLNTGYGRRIQGFSADGSTNPGLAAYNAGILVDDIETTDFGLVTGGNDLEDYNIINGRRISGTNGLLGSVYGFHTNINEVYNLYRTIDNNQYQLNLSGAFEIVPKSGGRHSIEFGLLYEQQENRTWAIAPVGLWQTGRQLLNSHFDGVDTNAVVGYNTFITLDGSTDSTALHPYLAKDGVWASADPQSRTDQQSYFDNQVRTRLGYSRDEYIFIDEIRPEDLSLDMFSADELLDDFGGISYFGYDYLGNPLRASEVSFDDFFTVEDADGNKTRPVAPNTPIYTAAYIQDKFRYRDIIFRVGLRVDRYDANTKILKDNYSLFETIRAGDYAATNNVTNPGNIGDDFVVYETDLNSGVIRAYRDGEQWYTAAGEPVNSSTLIFGGTQAIPALVDPTVDDPRDLNYDYEGAFEDAEPQVVFMPRLAFSFPISDKAGFFAHYDVLTQRPPSNTLATPIDYYRFYSTVQNNGNLNNPNLRPERTIDYEVGFQQALTTSSALKISLYYKELRDMIQSQYYAFAYPLSYFGYGNQDYGTVKGMTLQYDLRRTGNVRMVANYTLQFADGTGSNVGSQRGFANRGNLRNIFPMSFDERHRLTLTFDYRYRSGKRYNGPVVFDKQILANAGLNILGIAASGRPYSRSQVITGPFDTDGVIGGYNSARLPWNIRFDLRLDKDFVFTVGKSDDNKDARPVSANIYLRVQNLLDARNLLGVYTYSQSPDDTGYLNSPQGVNQLDQIGEDAMFYQSSYQWAMLNPGFYTLPRRIFVGAIFSF